jgi:hypothetical protein
MQVRHATATFTGPGTMDDPFMAVIARQELEAVTAEDRAELWFELGSDESGEVSRLSIDLGYTDIEELLRLAPEDEILLELDSDVVEGLFSDYDVEAHGLKGAIAIAVTGAALLAPASQAANPLSYDAAATVQRVNVAATVQDHPAATVQVARTQVAKVQVAKTQIAKTQVANTQVAKTMVLRASGFQLFRNVLTQ